MIQVDPSNRPTFDTLLHTSRGTVFPECFFSFLHNYVTTVNELPAESPFKSSASSNPIPSTMTATARASNVLPEGLLSNVTDEPLPNDSDHRMQRMWADYESVEPYLVPDATEEPVMDVNIDYDSSIMTTKAFQVGNDISFYDSFP